MAMFHVYRSIFVWLHVAQLPTPGVDILAPFQGDAGVVEGQMRPT